MGCKISKISRTNLNFRDFSSLASETMFSIDELEALYVLYKKLSSCIVDDGFIHKEEFRQALLRNSGKPDLFVDRVCFDLFDIKHNGVLNYGEFVKSLSIFHPKSPTEDKILFTFKLYDLRNKGYIEREEVKEMVIAILEESDLKLPDDIVDTIVEKAFVEADSNLDGRIDLQEWKEFVCKNPSLLKNMTIPYLMDVTTAFPSFVVNTKKPSKIVAPKKFYLPMPEKNNSKGEHDLVSVTYISVV